MIIIRLFKTPLFRTIFYSPWNIDIIVKTPAGTKTNTNILYKHKYQQHYIIKAKPTSTYQRLHQHQYTVQTQISTPVYHQGETNINIPTSSLNTNILYKHNYQHSMPSRRKQHNIPTSSPTPIYCTNTNINTLYHQGETNINIPTSSPTPIYKHSHQNQHTNTNIKNNTPAHVCIVY